MKIKYDIEKGTGPYDAVVNKIRKLTTDKDGCEHIGTYIVRIYTTVLGVSNELLLWNCETNDYYWDNDWFEGGEVKLLGFIEMQDVKVPLI